MDEFIKWVADNPYWVVAGLCATFLGLIISIGTIIFQRKRRALFYSLSTTILIENSISKIEGIEVLYKGKKIDSILVSTLHLWNGGNTLLTKDSFYPDCTLKLKLEADCEFLGIETISESSDTCKFSTVVEQNNIYLNFDYMERRQGIVLNLYHTFTEMEPLAVLGHLIEGDIVNKTVEIESKVEAIHISTKLFDIKLDNPFFNVFVNFFDAFGVRIKRRKK